jgi:SAM-dependent methyltransferase
MSVEGERPLYHEFAWAYDLLFDDDVAPFTDRVIDVLAADGTGPGSRVLDAGCGTGRYTAELARRGFVVEGVDGSQELVAYGRAHNVPHGIGARLHLGDLRKLAASEAFYAVVCRGVLNDTLDEEDRRAVVTRLAASLRPAGVLILDVRDWLRTVESVRERPLVEKTVETGDVCLTFRSDREVDEAHRLLISREAITAGERTAAGTFRMRPWSEPELRTVLERAGCRRATISSGFRVRRGETISDRIFCSAVRG